MIGFLLCVFYLNLDHPVYDILPVLYISGEIKNLPIDRPYDLDGLLSSELLKKYVGKRWKFFSYFFADVFYCDSPGFHLSASFYYSDEFFSLGWQGIGGTLEGLPLARPWRGEVPFRTPYMGFINKQGYLSFTFKRTEFLFGRFPLLEGPGWNSGLLVSPKPYDVLMMKYKINDRIKLKYFVLFLDKYEEDSVIYKRWFSFHEISIRFKGLTLGLSEAILYGRTSYVPELYYLNPVLLWIASQHNCWEDDNLFFKLEFALDLRGLRIYGEFLVDDFQYAPDPRGEPNEIGGIIGVQKYFKNEFLNYLWIEYRAVTAWVYNQKHPRNRLVYYGECLGNEFGPDGDKLLIKLGRLKSGRLMELEAYIQRKGENEIETQWPDVFPGDYFLMGKVKRDFGIILKCILVPQYRFEIGMGTKDKILRFVYTVSF